MKKVLVLGDFSQVRWHSLFGMRPLLELLGKDYDFLLTEGYPGITKSSLDAADICINYIDNWEDRGCEEAEEVFLSYVKEGGMMLTLHNGIIMKKSESLLRMQGGCFTGHDAYGELQYRIAEDTGDSVLTKDISEFLLMEEPYCYDLYSQDKKHIFLEYQKDGQWYPAGWVQRFGAGRIVYLAPGHDERTFKNHDFIRLVKNAMDYLLSCKKEVKGERTDEQNHSA